MKPEESRLERIQKRLNRRGPYDSETKRAGFSRPRAEVRPSWEGEDLSGRKPLRGTNSLLKKLFLFSVIFFVLVVLVAFYIVGSGGNVVSSGNIDITVAGPISMKGGEELTLAITVANNNTVPLEFVDLIVIFPDGTRNADNIETEQARFRKNLGNLSPGEVHNETVKAVLFGSANTEHDIKVLIEYRLQGSNAIFVKEKEYPLQITSSPIDIAVAVPEEIRSGSPIDIDIEISSNASEPLEDILAQVTYPSGFRFEGASPEPTFGNNTWDLGDLNSDRSRSITVTGTMEGQDQQKKLFKVTSGIRSVEREDAIGVPYAESFETLEIKRAFVDLDLAINGQSGQQFIATAGQTLRAELNWSNNIPEKILNGEFRIRLIGDFFDENEIEVQRGFFNSSNNTIEVDRRHNESLAIIEPGAVGKIEFEISSHTMDALRSIAARNPEIIMEVLFTGTRVLDGKPGGTVTADMTRSVRVNSHVSVVSRGLRSIGPFVNTGPLPPRANVESTYTIILSVTNSVNALDEAQVVAKLPSYVKWLGVISPQGEQVSFSETSGEVTWNLRSVDASSSASPVRELAIQVSLLPSVSQVGSAPTLLSNIIFEAIDTFTGVTLTDTARNINTRIETDPTYLEQYGTVIP